MESDALLRWLCSMPARGVGAGTFRRRVRLDGRPGNCRDGICDGVTDRRSCIGQPRAGQPRVVSLASASRRLACRVGLASASSHWRSCISQPRAEQPRIDQPSFSLASASSHRRSCIGQPSVRLASASSHRPSTRRTASRRLACRVGLASASVSRRPSVSQLALAILHQPATRRTALHRPDLIG